jgi:predicted ATPase/class 3 adenylate cyclase
MPDLPTGTVTFLITDIEGSTRLLQELGEGYRDVQRRHDTILRSAIAAGDGREVSTEGDSFFAVFATPSGALRAIGAAQRDLAAEPWPEGAALRVRMGVHTGEGILGGSNYLGLDVNRTARISAAAHGGQVLASDATRALVDRDLPAGLQLRDLGEHRLADLSQPERLHQVVIDGLEAEFPPLRSLDARPNNLPAQLTRFVGRESEIAAVRELLATHRLVTLTGPGGTGKTRLALRVAVFELTNQRDGVFFIDLSALTDADDVPQVMATALRVRTSAGRPILETLAEHLRDRELLMVVDNFEQVLDGGPSVVEPLLSAAAGIRVLATSRVPLHLYGEREYAVQPLAETEARALFADRATAAREGFEVTAANAPAVAEITARLDGLPLAIELAASRMKVLSPETLLERLEQRLPLLSAQDRNVPERQRTLRQTIEWSYDLLTDPERRMFWRLAVFAGGADLEAADAVANSDGELGLDTLDGVASLVDKNLLLRRADAPEGEPRFGMLETIREYGLERLSVSEEEPEIRRRHAEHWIAVGERATGGLYSAEQAATARRLELDHDNYRAALRWLLDAGNAELGLRLAVALRDFWRLSFDFVEGVRWLDELLALPAAAARSTLRARALTAAADLSSWMGEVEPYLRRAEEAVSIYRELDDELGLPDALEELGVAQLGLGQGEAARASLEEARSRNLALGNRQKAGECTLALGMVAMFGQQPDEARGPLEEALATFTQLGDPYWTAFAQLILAGVEYSAGDNDTAERWVRVSLASGRDHGLLNLVASGLYSMAAVARVRGDAARSLRLVGASVAIRERIGDAPAPEMALMGDVRAAAAEGMDADAADRFYAEGHAMEQADAIAYALEPAG